MVATTRRERRLAPCETLCVGHALDIDMIARRQVFGAWVNTRRLDGFMDGGRDGSGSEGEEGDEEGGEVDHCVGSE